MKKNRIPQNYTPTQETINVVELPIPTLRFSLHIPSRLADVLPTHLFESAAAFAEEAIANGAVRYFVPLVGFQAGREGKMMPNYKWVGRLVTNPPTTWDDLASALCYAVKRELVLPQLSDVMLSARTETPQRLAVRLARFILQSYLHGCAVASAERLDAEFV